MSAADPARPSVAIVLPPGERFAPAAAGAIALVVRALAAGPSRYAVTVLGPAQPAPFPDIAFRAVAPAAWPAPLARRYAIGAARVLAAHPPDLIEVHNRPDIALRLASRFPAIPVVLILHNDPQGMRALPSAARRARLLDRLAGVATVSGWLRGRLLEGVAPPARPPVVLPNAIDLGGIPASPPMRELLILFAGRITADKGADAFVAACARALPRLPGWRAAMIGADRFGADSPDTRFVRALRPAAAAAGVAMAGYRPHADVLAAMAGAAIVVVPSRWPEPFGLTALEAMACGAALLCAPRGGLPEVVGDAAVPIDPDDPAAMAEAIIALAGDPDRRAALGRAGRVRAGEFDIARSRAALDGLRDAVLAAWSPATRRPI
jgi:glycosyltransferase involved in cell wall biosynthesis